jgi:hypothetical protein
MLNLLRTTVRSPEYFPSLDFWALMLASDSFEISDHLVYERQSFQNRSKLRTPDGWQWISVPLKGGQRGRTIAATEIDNTAPWARKHLRAMQYNYRSSPYFEACEDQFESFFSNEWVTLGALTIASIELMCSLIGLPVPPFRRAGGGEEIRSSLVLQRDRQMAGSILLHFDHPTYQQNFDGFVAGLSGLDAFFNSGPATIELIRDGISDISPVPDPGES